MKKFIRGLTLALILFSVLNLFLDAQPVFNLLRLSLGIALVAGGAAILGEIRACEQRMYMRMAWAAVFGALSYAARTFWL